MGEENPKAEAGVRWSWQVEEKEDWERERELNLLKHVQAHLKSFSS